MSTCWCALCDKHEDACDCVLVTADLIAAMAKEWREARAIIEYVAHERGGSVGMDEFPELDRMFVVGECTSDVHPVAAADRGEDTCA